MKFLIQFFHKKERNISTMNKKDIAQVRKEFKDDSFQLRIRDLFIVYIQKEKFEVFHKEFKSFSFLEQEQQDLYRQNFKKVLSGNLDEKLFLVEFDKTNSNVNNTQQLLLDSLECTSEEFQEYMLELVSRTITEEITYKDDIIFSFVRAEYRHIVPKTKKDEESNGIVQKCLFFSMNKTTKPKQALLFDYLNKEFKSNLVLDAMINLTSPIQGFMFPTISGTTVNVNRVLYSTGKKNAPDTYFIERVLQGLRNKIDTVDNEVAYFNEVLNIVLNGKTSPQILSKVYYRINRIVEGEKAKEEDNEEEIKLDYQDISNILVASGVDSNIVQAETVREAFKEILDNEKYEFNAEHLLTKQDFVIRAQEVKLSVNAIDFQKIRQIQHPNGKIQLIIDIDKEIEVNGLIIESEVN